MGIVVSAAGAVVAVVGAGYDGKRKIHARMAALGARLVSLTLDDRPRRDGATVAIDPF